MSDTYLGHDVNFNYLRWGDYNFTVGSPPQSQSFAELVRMQAKSLIDLVRLEMTMNRDLDDAERRLVPVNETIKSISTLLHPINVGDHLTGRIRMETGELQQNMQRLWISVERCKRMNSYCACMAKLIWVVENNHASIPEQQAAFGIWVRARSGEEIIVLWETIRDCLARADRCLEAAKMYLDGEILMVRL
jgi:hypothetical protein